MENLPAPYSNAVGQIVYSAARVEFLLGRMLPEGATGLSGKRLVEALRAADITEAVEVLEGYSRLTPLRNTLIHGTYQLAEDHIMVWHLHYGGNTLTSHPFTAVMLEDLATSWGNLSDAVHMVLHQLEDRPGNVSKRAASAHPETPKDAGSLAPQPVASPPNTNV